MIYFSFWEIRIAILSFFALGCFFAVFYQSLICIYNFLKLALAIPIYSFLKYNNIEYIDFNLEQKHRNKLLSHLLDFVFIILFGIVSLLFYYVFLDGTIRLFPFIFTLIGYSISLKLSSIFFSKIINKVLHSFLKTLLHIEFIILFPIFFVLTIIKKLLTPIIILLINKYHNFKLIFFIKRKTKKIEFFFLKK